MQLIAGADRRWLPVAQVRAEDGQGQPLPASLLPLHHGQRLPRQEAGDSIHLPWSNTYYIYIYLLYIHIYMYI